MLCVTYWCLWDIPRWFRFRLIRLLPFFCPQFDFTPFKGSSFFPISPLPQTAGEWAQVLQLQRQFHQAQLSKWQQILQSSVTLLDQVGVFFYDARYRSFFTHAYLGIGLLCVLISLLLYISDEAVFRKAPQWYRGPGVAAGCFWWSTHRDPTWGLSFLVSTPAFSTLVDLDKYQLCSFFFPLLKLTQNGENYTFRIWRTTAIIHHRLDLSCCVGTVWRQATGGPFWSMLIKHMREPLTFNL